MKKEILFAALGALCADHLNARDITREKIDKLLADLAAKPAPEAKRSYAMCYVMVAPPQRAEYVCPKCGGKTIHTERSAKEVEWTLRSHRSQLDKIVRLGLDAYLDERALCDKCRNEAGLKDGSSDFYLEVTLNGNTARTLLRGLDWEILIAFLEGKIEIKNMDGTRPLKPHVPRIRELLGLDIKTNKTNTSTTTTTSTTATTSSTTKPPAPQIIHTVEEGETLSSISRKYTEQFATRVSINEIITANNIADPDKIKAGQKLLIPKK